MNEEPLELQLDCAEDKLALQEDLISSIIVDLYTANMEKQRTLREIIELQSILDYRAH